MKSLSVEPGDFKHSIAIQVNTEGRDATGGMTESWATVETVWGNIRPMTGRELFEAQQVKAQVTHKVLMRKNTTVTPSHRLLLEDARILHIASVVDVGERGVLSQLLCTESV